MLTSSTYSAVARRSLPVLALIFLCGCAALVSSRKSTEAKLDSDTVSSEPLPIDPWSLGPDVFAMNVPPGDSLSPAHEYSSAKVEVDSTIVTESLDASAHAIAVEPIVEAAPQLPDTIFTVQLGTFLEKDRAQALYDRASESLGLSGRIEADWPFYRLQFGDYPSRTSADSLHRVAMSRGFYDARVLKIPPR